MCMYVYMNRLLAKYVLKYNFYILHFTSSSCMKPLFSKFITIVKKKILL